MGNVTSVTDEKGNTTSYEYSLTGELVKVTDALGHSTLYGYDAAGRLAKMEQHRLIDESYADIMIADINNAIGGTTANGDTVNGAAFNIAVSGIAANNENKSVSGIRLKLLTTSWHRNLRGDVTEVHNPLGGVSRYAYDASGNMISRIDEDGHETLYAYNLVNMLSKVTYSDGKTVELTYNPLRQLTELKDWLGTTGIELNTAGQATKITDHEGYNAP